MSRMHTVYMFVILVIGLATTPVWAEQAGLSHEKILLADNGKKYERLQDSGRASDRNDGRADRDKATRDSGDGRQREKKTYRQEWKVNKSDRRDVRYYKKNDYRYDTRYNHNHYYPPIGLSISLISRPYQRLYYRDSDYYFDVTGVWYSRSGASFSVVMPPVGIVVPLLPAEYSTIWVDSSPYYYAGGVYYAWRPSVSGYVVVPAPNERKIVGQADQSEELFIYPRAGQNEEQQANDRYECHRWAVSQTGFDPTLPAGGVALGVHADRFSGYQRAMKACLDGRDYSVK